MTRYALEASEIVRFTPASLASLPLPPVFLIKPATRRERRLHQRLIVENGLRFHDAKAIRAEMLRVLQAEWSPELFEENEQRLQQFWLAVDSHRKEQAERPETERTAFEHPDIEPVAVLTDQLTQCAPTLRKMAADNLAFSRDNLALLVGCLMVGWEQVGPPFKLEAGCVPLDRIEDVADWLAETETAHAGKIEGVGEPGTAFAELCSEAGAQAYLSEEERKNSASPSTSPATPNGSTMDGPASGNGSSETMSTTETPAT